LSGYSCQEAGFLFSYSAIRQTFSCLKAGIVWRRTAIKYKFTLFILVAFAKKRACKIQIPVRAFYLRRVLKNQNPKIRNAIADFGIL
jgi:hypothetical protein